MASSSFKALAAQASKYLGVGAGTALLELALFWLLSSPLHLDVAIANVIAVVVATVTNFLLNRSVTFASTSNPARSAVLYALLFAFNTAFSTITISYFASLGAPAIVVKVITMACIVCWNFVLYRKVVFK